MFTLIDKGALAISRNILQPPLAGRAASEASRGCSPCGLCGS